MTAEELAELIAVCLRDELVAKVVREGCLLKVVFIGGTERTIRVA